MMRTMREKVKIIYWVVIVTFVGLMFLVWGVGDYNSPARQASDITIATVNGQEIGRTAWERRAQAILSSVSARQGGSSRITESDRLRARDQAFDELVDEMLLQEEADLRGLRVTDEEITDLLRNNPPPALLAQYEDIDDYYADLDNSSVNWNRVRETLRATIPLQKLDQSIQASAVVGEAELRQAYGEQTTRMVSEYVGLLFSEIELEDETVSNAEAQNWYEARLDDYTQPARSSVRIVKLDKVASQADEEEILSILQEIRDDIVSGRLTFEEAARTYSEDTSASVGGDLGFFDRDRMVEPFTEVAFDLALGDVSEPVKTQFGYHIIECTDERLSDAGAREEMRARHLLLNLTPTPNTVDDLRDRVDQAHASAKTGGLAQAAEQLEVEIVETAPFQEGFNIPGIANSLPGARFAFQRDTGRLSPMFENEEAFYFFTIAEKLPTGHRPLADVRSLVDSAVRSERKSEIAVSRLATALEGINADSDLSALPTGDGGLHYAITDTFTLRENITDIGFATSFARVALAMDVGEFKSGVKTRRGIYALKLLHKSEFDEARFTTQRAQLARQVLFTRQRILLQQWLQERREEAEIIDHRSDLL